jgi:L-amino acid N-acyltransferase YncA
VRVGPGASLPRLLEITAWQGPAGLVFRALALIGFRVLYWYVLPNLREARPVEATVPITVAELGPADVAEYVEFRRGSTPEQFRARLERGCRCYVARVEGATVSAVWVATQRGRIEGFHEDFELGPKQMYSFDSFTLPEHRGRRIQGELFTQLYQDYLARGIEQAVALTGPENRATMKSRGRSGFVRTGGIVRIDLGPWRWRFAWGSREI